MPMTRKNTPELLPGTLDMMILKTLNNGSNHGYGIVGRIQQLSDDVLLVEEGSLYPALHRLEQRGFLTSTWKRSENNRRAKFYRLSAKGRRHLASEVRRWTMLAAAVDKVLGDAEPVRTVAG
jgi:transcriptional regulator